MSSQSFILKNLVLKVALKVLVKVSKFDWTFCNIPQILKVSSNDTDSKFYWNFFLYIESIMESFVLCQRRQKFYPTPPTLKILLNVSSNASLKVFYWRFSPTPLLVKQWKFYQKFPPTPLILKVLLNVSSNATS